MRPEIGKAFELLQSGNAEQLEQALGLLQKTVFAFSMNVCGHREDAEDTMQDVMLKAIPYLPKFDSPQALTAWLYTVARNRCWMSRRRSKFAPKQHLSLDELLPQATEMDRLREIASSTPSPERVAIASQDAEQLKTAILELPPQYRLVLVLHDIEELSTEEIARILGLKEGNVRVRLHRARLFVRKNLAEAEAKRTKPRRAAKRSARTDASGAKGASGAEKERSRMSCRCRRIFANLSDYLDGVLDETLCAELERHMEGCEPCKAFLATLQQTIDGTRQLGRDAGLEASAKMRLPLKGRRPAQALNAAR